MSISRAPRSRAGFFKIYWLMPVSFFFSAGFRSAVSGLLCFLKRGISG
jgi:hypothetical protein